MPRGDARSEQVLGVHVERPAHLTAFWQRAELWHQAIQVGVQRDGRGGDQQQLSTMGAGPARHGSGNRAKHLQFGGWRQQCGEPSQEIHRPLKLGRLCA